MRRDHEGAALGHLFDDVAVAASTSSAAARSSATDADGRVDLRERGADLEDHEQMHTLRGVRLEAGQCDDATCFSGGEQACGGVDTPVVGDGDHADAERLTLVEHCLVVVILGCVDRKSTRLNSSH